MTFFAPRNGNKVPNPDLSSRNHLLFAHNLCIIVVRSGKEWYDAGFARRSPH
jgi:hypothetical protein